MALVWKTEAIYPLMIVPLTNVAHMHSLTFIRQASGGAPALAFAFVLTRIVQTGEEPVKVALRLASLDL
jgi:hypothetical protein